MTDTPAAPAKDEATIEQSSIDRTCNGDLQVATSFLEEAARYFENRPTNGEDRAHWSNVQNAENCRKVAAHIAALTTQLEAETARADAAEKDAKALREALEIAEETLAMAERPSFEDPHHKDEIEALGNRIGFGALMSSASATWRRLDGNGAEFVCGPCHVTVLNALTRIRATLAQPAADGGK